MSFGKFYPASESIIGKKTIKKPSGYSGLFWGTVYDTEDKVVENASTYFSNLADEEEDLDTFEYWETIYDKINLHCAEYIDPYIDEDERYHVQIGFGGSYCDGLIEFWSPVLIPEMPNLKFKIKDKQYTIKWEFSSGCD